MAPATRRILGVALLLAGVAWTLPMQTGRPDHATPAAAAAPLRFDVRVRRDVLYLDGHTRSARHEAQLGKAAATSFPGMTHRPAFTPLGIAPDWWSDATTALLEALATLQSPTARLRETNLRIEALAADPAAAASHLEALREWLPATVEVSVAIASAGAGADTRALCERQFATFEHEPVGFEESSVTLLSSALPVLDRVVALADACRGSTISVTGHTDASGDEGWNQQLSLARASAVAEYLAGRGIDRERVAVTGAGSSFPVADNATRYGRSLNRRIELGLSY